MRNAPIPWIFRQAFTAAPVLLSTTTVAAAALAAVPAVQVLLIGAVIAVLSGDAPEERVIPLLLALGLVAGFAPALEAIVGSLQARASQKLQARLNVLVASEAAKVPPSLLVTTAISAEIERHSRAIGEGIAWSVRNMLAAATSILAAVGVVAAVFSYSIVAGLLTVAALLPPILHSRYLAGVWEREWDAVAPHYDRERYLRDLIVRQRSAAELSGLGSSERVAGMVAEEWTTIQRIMGRALVPQAVGSALGGIVTAALLVGAIVSVAVGVRFESTAAAGIYGVLSAMAAASGAGASAGIALELVPQIARLQRFLETRRPSRAVEVTSDAASLAVDAVSHRYREDAPFALREASVRALKGEIVAIVGPNGAGKTTLVHAITGLLDTSGGTVSVDGIERRQVSEAQWLSRFALMTQEFGRFELTVREAVTLGTPRADIPDHEVWEALRRARAEELVRSMPDGLDQQLGEQFGGVGVSGGQWQRLALARIHLRGAPIWILDEPTSAIDAETENEIFAELADGRSERITLVVSHRAWTLRVMDRIYVVDEGRIVETGTYDELLAAGGRFAEIFASQH